MPSRTHGHTNPPSPTYNSWRGMKDRCGNTNRTDSEYYSLIGVRYDPRWNDFQAFLDDMGVRPPGTTLDRVNSKGMYCKDNCRWATHVEQQNNRRPRRKPGKRAFCLGITRASDGRAWQYYDGAKYVGRDVCVGKLLQRKREHESAK